MRNLEIKAAVPSLVASRARLRRLPGASPHATVRQTDWYFDVPRGRMKLREIVEGRGRAAELIVYLRPNRRTARTSRFVRLPAAECAATRGLLTGMFGVSVCVRKRREVWLYENARIHLDRVSGLGTFVEIEVVVTRGMRQAQRVMARLRATLGIEPSDVVGESYADLLRAIRPATCRSDRHGDDRARRETARVATQPRRRAARDDPAPLALYVRDGPRVLGAGRTPASAGEGAGRGNGLGKPGKALLSA